MPHTARSNGKEVWTNSRAYAMGVICLLVGMAGGWFVRGSQSTSTSAPSPAATQPSSGALGNTGEQPTPEQMKRMGDAQAAPLLERLKSSPNDPELLAKLGNIYYDTQQYSIAIDYYQRSLALQASNASIRTDMATAEWYSGNADKAITEFNKALTYEPNNANTLFNLGIVKWQGKMDIGGAVEAWQRLLDTNPNYENKAKVQELMAQARKHTGIKAGTKPQS
jgi:cytochrome c-type biogenesis protein CcmH/NrfG